MSDVTFTLRTDIADGKLVYVSESGPTKGQINPELKVPKNAVVQINVVNGDGALHDIAIPDFNIQSDNIAGKGAAMAVVFRAGKEGTFEYLCTLPGHKAAGMFGKLIVGDVQAQSQTARDPKTRWKWIASFTSCRANSTPLNAQRHGSSGMHEFSLDKLLNETPEHMMFNGNMGALTQTHKMEANVGETVRIYFGVGGPNLVSNFHVIGEVFDKVYDQG